MKKSLSFLLAVGLILAASSSGAFAEANASSAKPPATANCEPVNGLSFVCGLNKPEDLILVPGTKWLVAGGVAPGAQLMLVDTEAKVAKPFYLGRPDQVRLDASAYPQCPGAPDAAGFAPHGLSLRPAGAEGQYRLYAVSHLALEGIQIFDLDARGAEPKVVWRGCVPFPKGMTGNAVAAFSDGAIVATVRGAIAFEGPKASPSGVTVGAVASWKPGQDGFHQLPGTLMFGPNGIEVSSDDKDFYVVSVEEGAVSVFSRADTSKAPRKSRAPLTSLDNIHWTGGRLIAAGKMFDEPACGGTRQHVVNKGQGIHDCVRGYAAVELDPTSLGWRVVAYAEPNPPFDGVATAVPVGKTLWLSSFLTDRVGYRPLPGVE